MATTWIGDTYRPSGALAGTFAPVKESAVGAWTITAAPAGETFARSSSGLTVAVGGSHTFSTIFGYSPGSGVRGTAAVAEAALYGGLGLLLVVGGSQATLRLNAGPLFNKVELLVNGMTTEAAMANRVWTTLSVLRIEADDAGFRAYVDGTLALTDASSTPTVSTDDVVAAGFLYSEFVPPPFSTTTLVADYLHVVRDTASGPLGSPAPSSGGLLTLPRLTFNGGEYAKGNAAYSLPLLYAVPAPIPPTFWAAKVGVREA